MRAVVALLPSASDQADEDAIRKLVSAMVYPPAAGPATGVLLDALRLKEFRCAGKRSRNGADDGLDSGKVPQRSTPSDLSADTPSDLVIGPEMSSRRPVSVKPTGALQALAEALRALPAKLTDAQAQQALDPLLQQIGVEMTDSGGALQALQAVAAKLTKAQAQQALAPLLQQIGKTTNPYALRALAHLPATAANSERRTVRKTLTEEFERILRRMIAVPPAQQNTFLQFAIIRAEAACPLLPPLTTLLTASSRSFPLLKSSSFLLN
jgi:hypothetical protein